MVREQARGERPFLLGRLAGEAEFRRRVETADRLGIPGSQLDGREPASTTRYFYGRSGRLVRSVTTQEPRWTEQDRAEAIALGIYRASLCPNGCGQPVAESTAHWTKGPEYDATSTTCRACAALAESQRAAQDRNPDAVGRLWRIDKQPRGAS